MDERYRLQSSPQCIEAWSRIHERVLVVSTGKRASERLSTPCWGWQGRSSRYFLDEALGRDSFSLVRKKGRKARRFQRAFGKTKHPGGCLRAAPVIRLAERQLWSTAPAPTRARPPKKRGRRDARFGEQNALRVARGASVGAVGDLNGNRNSVFLGRRGEAHTLRRISYGELSLI